MKITTLLKIKFFLLLFFISTFNSFSQEQEITEEKGIILERKDSTYTTFIKENKRIKVKLLNGNVYVGRLKVVDDKTISIRENTIPLESIAKIKRRSVVSTIIRPILFYYGGGLLGVGAILLATEYAGVGAIFAAVGLPMVLIPIISENHRPEKWNYSTGTNPKNKKINAN